MLAALERQARQVRDLHQPASSLGTGDLARNEVLQRFWGGVVSGDFPFTQSLILPLVCLIL